MHLTGEGDYNLNSIKYEDVTESFLGLDQDVRGCQNEERYDECTTHLYIENMKGKCGCLPLSIALSNQVNFLLLYFKGIKYYHIKCRMLSARQTKNLNVVQSTETTLIIQHA